MGAGVVHVCRVLQLGMRSRAMADQGVGALGCIIFCDQQECVIGAEQ